MENKMTELHVSISSIQTQQKTMMQRSVWL